MVAYPRTLHVVLSIAFAILLLVVGAALAEPLHLPLLHGWALAHGTLFVLFPLNFGLGYLLLRPAMYGRGGRASPDRPSLLPLAAFVLGLAGFVTFGVLSLIGLILALKALRAPRSSARPRDDGLAWAALVVSCLTLVYHLVYLVMGILVLTLDPG